MNRVQRRRRVCLPDGGEPNPVGKVGLRVQGEVESGLNCYSKKALRRKSGIGFGLDFPIQGGDIGSDPPWQYRKIAV